MNIKLSQHLPKTHTQKILKKEAKSKDDACLVVLVDDKKNILAESVLTEYTTRIEQLIEVSHFKGTTCETVADYALAGDKKTTKQNPVQLLLVGVGNTDKFNNTVLQKIANTIYSSTQKRVSSITVALGDALEENHFGQFALNLLAASYRFDKYKSEQATPVLTDVYLLADESLQPALAFAQSVFAGQSLTRDVANEPGNICFPAYMAEQAQELAKTYPDLLTVKVLGEDEMSALGMHCFLAVAQGSTKEGKLVLMEYRGKSEFSSNAGTTEHTTSNAKVSGLKALADKLPTKKSAKNASKNSNDNAQATNDDAPIVLVGKGVTFDSGGISIKPGAAMDEMKFDMGGSASVLGTIKALCEARLPINVVGALACAENMPSGDATRPGDIVKAMNGKSVEILNTDAEGRLVLADTLCYVQRYQPKAIIDVATLTGACVVALGHVRSAVFSNDEDVLFDLENASNLSGDLIWHMPLDDEYQAQLDSPIADMQNIGGKGAGAVTAACFLSRFIEEGQAWAHLDIAGTAWNSGKDKAATGRPVPLFMQYLKNSAEMA
ncbi:MULTISPECIES: leucyl aminopeptidase [unclassified Psychrobacter]|uniref:leucyl aminopeptidase n=1 Tax=unclassified Psychrobacter TaxID=196806 RepID=UPI000C342ABA|nr:MULTISPECIES: leucyl aminopeptidase [unclassified Psychrobacter]MBA6244995.1 leucyl aminopeptidase [Psychrobacter sp. Urea-trap-18]MBA6286540.1 leucyl aminopeptidase [Psychrobacter sp. Urea-trap-16]MBA6318551.1 leucyl aminopeptidase [Psychrobacter sp. Urea-trap-20]MBA6334772.1 leucyl aminopeptidase [Psychrobacter sp. Urea-trap-19]PKG61402.1 leucyl aminopeptidase [Psychrobacter sp. Choline-3u-12]